MAVQLPKDYVYLDYAATSPLCEEAASAMAPYLLDGLANFPAGGNANSLHSIGRAAFEKMEQHRRSIAQNLGVRRPDEVVFTSGATEADAAAIIGLSAAELKRRRKAGQKDFTPHVIVSAIEHDAVLCPAKSLKSQGYHVTHLRPTRDGFIEPAALEAAIDEETVLVSIQMANSEIGSIQPIADLAALAHRYGALFHTDAVQALGKLPINLEQLGVDAASFSAHKIGGPKGVGVLYLRTRTPFSPLILGGGQEAGRRSGTQNLCGIAGFAAACEASVHMLESEGVRLRLLRDMLYDKIGAMPGVQASVVVPAGSDRFLPHIVHVLLDDYESETLILRLDTQGFAVSGGSACASHSLEPSHVLTAMGINSDAAQRALRVSMGRHTTQAEVEAFLSTLNSCLLSEA